MSDAPNIMRFGPVARGLTTLERNRGDDLQALDNIDYEIFDFDAEVNLKDAAWSPFGVFVMRGREELSGYDGQTDENVNRIKKYNLGSTLDISTIPDNQAANYLATTEVIFYYQSNTDFNLDIQVQAFSENADITIPFATYEINYLNPRRSVQSILKSVNSRDDGISSISEVVTFPKAVLGVFRAKAQASTSFASEPARSRIRVRSSEVSQ